MNNRKTILTLFSWILILIITYQNNLSGQRSPSERAQFQIKAQSFLQEINKKKNNLRSKARSLNIPMEFTDKTGNRYFLKEIFGEHPTYEGLHNEDSQKTTNAYYLKPNRLSGYNLDGSGIKIGVWDGGKVRETHQEFQGRALQIDSDTVWSDHMTHVAGTIGAVGISPEAEGFSSNAALRCFNGGNDITEMTNEQMSTIPIVVSNHSYGTICGWTTIEDRPSWVGDLTVSSSEDWLFGAYTGQSQAMDQLAYDSKYYLIVRSAGNDHNNSGPAQGPHIHGWDTLNVYTDIHPNDGVSGYDCLPNTGTSKNILTIGAVEEIQGGYNQSTNVIKAGFSSTGPTDDGRIKPDLVAQGISLYSTGKESDIDYTFKSGTSMSAPSVTGALGLLYQQWENYMGGIPRSATMKGIAIHTTDEAGPAPGPDYHFGWGLMNTERAADLIALNTSSDCQVITEDVLLAGNTRKVYQFSSDGNIPIKATLIWTDKPGTRLNGGDLNPTHKNLEVDMDISILVNGSTYFPYVLDPNNPSAPATSGRNNTDNIEQIYIPDPDVGNYEITVNMPSALAENFEFTLITTGFNGPSKDLIINDSQITADKIFSTHGSITALGRTFIENGSRVDFMAADSITFLPDFTVTPRSQVIAKVGRSCSVE